MFRNLFVFVCLTAELAMESCAQELPQIIPRTVLFGNPEKTCPQISSDGQHLAYLATHLGGRYEK